MMNLYSFIRKARRDFGLSQGELATCLKLPKHDVIALESYRFVELDERQLEILAIYSGNLFEVVQRVYVAERSQFIKAEKKKAKTTSTSHSAEEMADAGFRSSMEEIAKMVAALPAPMQEAVVASFKAQLQCMALGQAS